MSLKPQNERVCAHASVGMGVCLAVMLCPATIFADNCGDLSDCYGNVKAAAIVGVAIVLGAILIVYLWPMIAAAATQTFIGLGEAQLLRSVAVGGGNLALGRYAGVIQRWGAVPETQKNLIREFLGKDVEGVLMRLGDFRVPPGLTRQTLELAAEVARHALSAGKPGAALQAARLGLLEDALKRLSSS